MGRFSTLVLGFTFAFAAFAGVLPVDEDIAYLRTKADQLEYFKALLEQRACTVHFSKTSVALSPGALRSEGLRITIGDNFPGNYLGYHNEPTPQAMLHDIAEVFKDAAKAEGAAFFSATLTQQPGEKAPSRLRVDIRDPQMVTEQVDDDPAEGSVTELRYVGNTLYIDLPLGKDGASVETVMSSGKKFKVECK